MMMMAAPVVCPVMVVAAAAVVVSVGCAVMAAFSGVSPRSDVTVAVARMVAVLVSALG